MIASAIILVYVGLLVLIRPAPESLKLPPVTYAQNFRSVRGSLLVGILIVLVYGVTADAGFKEIDDDAFEQFALANHPGLLLEQPFRALTHLVLHVNVFHLLSNLFGLGLLSAYERRVGIQRYGAVLLVGSLASVPSVFFYSDDLAVCGISGGLFALAAAYFTDQAKLSSKEWIAAISVFLLFATLVTFNGEIQQPAAEFHDVQVDHLGHLLGALAAIIYCRLNPLDRCQA